MPLDPCPFCHSEMTLSAATVEGWQVVHAEPSEDCPFMASRGYGDANAATSAWNDPLAESHRDKQQIIQLREELNRSDLLHDMSFACGLALGASRAQDGPVDFRELMRDRRIRSDMPSHHQGDLLSFQGRVKVWLLACFGPKLSADLVERNHRFLEEALELVQSLGCTDHEAHALVDYVFSRPVGEPRQEMGGTMVTLAALAQASNLDIAADGEEELSRVWGLIDRIRAKHAAKPQFSPLPGSI